MPGERPTFGSLFAGIGGIDLGLERAGWECRFQVEWDAYCQRVLAKHWPDVPRYGDITAIDWSSVERVDLLAGGFPCQPVSAAGRRRGQKDHRWLWPEFARAIRALRPRLVLVENVPGLFQPWRDKDGCGLWHAAPIEDVVAGLAASGYVGGGWDGLSAADLGAPHERDRRFLVAVEDTNGSAVESRWRGWRASEAGQPLPDATSERLQEPGRLGQSCDPATGREGQANHALDGRGWPVEPNVGRVAHGVPARVDRLRALGNAVVPQVVEVIGRQLLASLEAAA